MTRHGGVNNLGVIFKILPDGTGFNTLLDFDGAATGETPQGDLTLVGTTLYGMTLAGVTAS